MLTISGARCLYLPGKALWWRHGCFPQNEAGRGDPEGARMGIPGRWRNGEIPFGAIFRKRNSCSFPPPILTKYTLIARKKYDKINTSISGIKLHANYLPWLHEILLNPFYFKTHVTPFLNRSRLAFLMKIKFKSANDLIIHFCHSLIANNSYIASLYHSNTNSC